MKFIIELALETALRRSEIANIKPEHLKEKVLKIVKAKIKPRTIPLTKRAQELLKVNLSKLVPWSKLSLTPDVLVLLQTCRLRVHTCQNF
jgi:integrase